MKEIEKYIQRKYSSTRQLEEDMERMRLYLVNRENRKISLAHHLHSNIEKVWKLNDNELRVESCNSGTIFENDPASNVLADILRSIHILKRNRGYSNTPYCFFFR